MPPAFVQVANGSNLGAGPTISSNLAYGSSNTGGNLLVCVTTWFTAGITCSIADSNGNKWVPISTGPRFLDNSSASLVQAFYALNCKSGANTVTATWSGTGGTFQTISLAEYSGVNAFDGYDFDGASGWANCFGTGTTPASTLSGSAATHDSTELFIAYGGCSTTQTWTLGGGCTLRTAASNITAIEDKNITNGTYFPAFGAFGAAGSSNWAVGSMVFYQTDTTTFVQEVNHDDGIASGSLTDSMTFYQNVTEGNLIFAFSVWVSSVTASIGDSQGNIWKSPDGRQTQAGQFGQVFYCVARQSGPMTVTWSYSGAGATFIGASISEWKHFNTLDAHSVTGAASGTVTATNITTTVNNDLVISCFTTAAGHQVWTNGASYISRSTSSRSTGLESQFLVATGSVGATFTLAGATNWTVWLYGFSYLASNDPNLAANTTHTQLRNWRN